MICPKCQKELPEDAKFCLECGTPLESKESELENNEVEDIKEEVVQETVTDESETQEVTEDEIETQDEVKEDSESLEETSETNEEDTVEEVQEETKETKEEETHSNKIWYYVSNNQSVGPFSVEEMEDLIENKTIYGNTYVWKSGLKDWIYLKNSDLAAYLQKEGTNTKTETTSEDASWFYVNSSNQQMGPYTEEEMVQFIKEGIITANTYVWRSGMMDWIHCKDSTLFDRRSGSGGFNNYANGNTNKIFIETRSIPVCIILSIVTCGIYNLYWIYRLAKDVNTLNAAQQKPTGQDAGMVILLYIITCGLYGIYFYWKVGKLVKQLQFDIGYYVEDNSLVMMLLCIFGLGLISNCILQSTLNDIQRYA